MRTATAAVPALSTNAAGTTAVTCPLLTNVVASAEPFHNTCASFAKLLPLAVNTNCAAPAVTAAGEIDASVGAEPAPLPTVNDTAEEVPPPGAGVCAVMASVALLAKSPANNAILICVGETYVVTRFEPFTLPTVLGVKFDPVKTTVCAGEPAAKLLGETLVAVGAATVTVKGD